MNSTLTCYHLLRFAMLGFTKITMTHYKCVAVYVFAVSLLLPVFSYLAVVRTALFPSWGEDEKLIVEFHNETQRSTIFLWTTSVGHFTNSNCQVLHTMPLS